METNIKRSERRKDLRVRNNVICKERINNNVIAGCYTLNQCAEWLEKKYPQYSEDERDFMKNIFKNTYAGEVIKLIEKKMNKKTKKKPEVIKIDGDQLKPETTFNLIVVLLNK
jgi:hypothetical protein